MPQTATHTDSNDNSTSCMYQFCYENETYSSSSTSKVFSVESSNTGYRYFGARYYDSDLSVWLSVDPLASKYPTMSPYMYVRGNPVMLIDRWGLESEPVKRFNFFKRVWNGITFNGYKNKANKFQVDNNLPMRSTSENGDVTITQSEVIQNKKTNCTGIKETYFTFNKDGVSVSSSNSTTTTNEPERTYTYEQFFDIKGGAWLIGSSGTPNPTDKLDSNPDKPIDYNPEVIEIIWMKGKNFPVVAPNNFVIIRQTGARDSIFKDDTIGWMKLYGSDTIGVKALIFWEGSENLGIEYINK